MAEPVTTEAVDLIKSFEGCLKPVADGKLAPYWCPAHVATVGWGTTYYEGHRPVKITDAPITKERAGQLLGVQLASEYAPSVDKNLKVALHPLSRGACISLAYNIGTGAFAKSTALRMINQRRFSEVPRAFKMYRMGGGRVLAGLERRRAAEALMFMAGVKAMASGSILVASGGKTAPAVGAPAAGIAARFFQLFAKAA